MTTRRQGGESTSQTLVEDQIRGYRQNQRRIYNLRRATNRMIGSSTTGQILEQQIDPQAQLRLSMRERATIAPAEVLYRSRRDDAHHRVYVHRSEESMLVTDKFSFRFRASHLVSEQILEPRITSGIRAHHIWSIQKWYTDSRTSHLDYLDLAEDKNPSRKELAHNLAVIYDRTCLSSRVNLRNFKLLLEKTQQLDEKIQKLEKATKTLSALFKESKPLTKTEVRELVIEISKQPKVIEEEALRLTQNLDQKILRVEALLTKIEGQIFG